jgi:predicted AAA+ superfamily ATPase
MPCVGRARRLLDRLERVLGQAELVLGAIVSKPPDAEELSREWAFRWQSTIGGGRLVPIAEPALFDLDTLIGVDHSVAALDRNVRQLMAGLPFNDVLLHGERGTGKSSAVRGLLGRYGRDGLRVIEVDRADLVHLPAILDALRAGTRLYFIIFCDDLSFSPGEPGHRELKAALEGNLTRRPANTCIVATSNRRHLVPETMAENRMARVDEQGELHLGEALEEKLALADRFGLVLGFYNFDQATYLAIVTSYLEKAGISELDEMMRRDALRFALERGSRSGRTARQFVDDAVGRLRLDERR